MKDNLEKEAPKKDDETPTEGSQTETTCCTSKRNCEENEIDPLLLEVEKEGETPIYRQIVSTIGDDVIELYRGNITLRSGKVNDVLKTLNSNQNFSPFTSVF